MSRAYAARPTMCAERARGLAQLLERDTIARCSCGHTQKQHHSGGRQGHCCRQCECPAFEPEQQGAVSS